MHYLITGHTGFKGAWMTALLNELGHTVSGLSLDPLPGALFESPGFADLYEYDIRGDIRDPNAVMNAFEKIQPDVVIHLAAQALVLASYEDPVGTYETNVMGTLHVLDAISKTASVRASVIITTDKVYKNVNRVEGYREDEPLGGDDPYSASKAMADILTQSWVKSFPGRPLAIARAGNVIGGGDVSPDRLLPDLLNSIERGQTIELRNPDAVRPWQHVLDCVYGYYSLIQELLRGDGLGEWNFGPGPESFVSVSKVITDAQLHLGLPQKWSKIEAPRHEAQLLALNSEKAMSKLQWENQLKYPLCLEWTIDWARGVQTSRSGLTETLSQIRTYLDLVNS
jgi:CDP-glucose 4,6-dehydratase